MERVKTVMEILDKMNFFQGQRAGRELWNDKPFEVQEEDLGNFKRDIDTIGSYIWEIVKELKQYRDAEEQGLLLRLPCRLGDIIDRIISHNEIVTLMFETEVCSFRGLQHFWHGMAWNIPKEYLELPFVKIHGVVPDKITEADTIWIEVRKEAEQALARMEEENE